MKAYLWSDGEPLPTTRRARWRRFAERHLPSVVIYLMVATLVAVVTSKYSAVSRPKRFTPSRFEVKLLIETISRSISNAGGI